MDTNGDGYIQYREFLDEAHNDARKEVKNADVTEKT